MARTWKRHLTSVALIGAACALGAYAWLGERGTVSDTEKKARKGDVFPAWRREDLSEIALEFANGEKLSLERAPNVEAKGDGGELAPSSWQMKVPRHETADPDAVDKLIGQLEFATVVRHVTGDGVGLDAPRVRGSIVMGRVHYVFALGGAAPTPEGSAYFRVDRDAPIVVTRDFANELLRGPDAYRSRTIVPYLSVDLARFEMTNNQGKIAIERMNDTSFRSVGGGLRISRDGIDIVWRALADMRAEWFVSDAEADRAIDKPVITITMTPTTSPQHQRSVGELIVGGACPGHVEDVVVVRTKPTRVSACVPRGVTLGLDITTDAIADRHLFALREDEITEVRFEAAAGGPASFDVARKGSGWHERAPHEANLEGDEADAANALVTALAHGEGVIATADQAKTFVARARVAAIAGVGDRETEERLSIGDRDAQGGRLVRREADGAILRVEPALARKLETRATLLRSARLFSASVEGHDPIVVTTKCEGVTQEASHANGHWELRSPAGFAIDNARVTALVDGVERARALEWTADADDGHFGLDHACTVQLKIADDGGVRDVEIAFGAEGEGGIYARAGSDPAIAVVAPALRELASTSLIDGHGFQIDPDEVARVTLTHGNTSIVLSPDADAGHDADAIFSELAQLHADDVVHVGPARADEGFAPASLVVRIDALADASAHSRTFTIGAASKRGGHDVHFARIDGVDATFVLDSGKIAHLLAAALR